MEEHERDRRLLILKCARLYSRGVDQPAIAKLLQKTQSTVSRLLSAAVELKVLVPQNPKFQEHLVSADDLKEVDDSLSIEPNALDPLRKRFAGLGNFEFHVFPSGDRRRFGKAAAATVAGLLSRSECLGVSMGRTLAALIEAIGSEMKHRSAKLPVCVPVSGDCVFSSSHGDEPYSPSMLAARLEDLLTGDKKEDLPSLLGVPAYVSRNFGDSVLEFVRNIPGHRKLFYEEEPGGAIIDRLDTLLTGVGIITDSKESTGVCIQERLHQEKGLTRNRLKQLYLGEISGYLIERQRKQQLPDGDNWNSGWLGITGDKIEAIAKKVRPGGPPGVVLVAFGAAKAELVNTLVMRGWVNHLLIDLELGNALAEGF